MVWQHLLSLRPCRTPAHSAYPCPHQSVIQPGSGLPSPSLRRRNPLFDGSKTRSIVGTDGSETRDKVGAAFIHLHPFGSIIGSHLPPLTWFMSVLDAELCVASHAPQYAANRSAKHSKMRLLGRRDGGVGGPGWEVLGGFLLFSFASFSGGTGEGDKGALL